MNVDRLLLCRFRAVAAVLPLVTAAVLVPGCTSPKAQSQLAMREAQFQDTLNMARENEANRVERLDSTWSDAVSSYKRDTERFPLDVKGVGDAIRAEQKRWQERQGGYRQAIKEQLDGKPQNIPDTAIEMFY